MQHVASDPAQPCNRVSQAEAARRLGVNRSTLKRYLDRYPELVDGHKAVDPDELQAHRGDNWRVGDKPRPAAAAPATRRNAKTRLDEARAQAAEIDLAQRLGELVDPHEIATAVSEAAMALRDRLMMPDHALCERLAQEADPRVVQSLLRESSRVVLEEFTKALNVPGG